MTELRRRALARLAIPEGECQKIYDTFRRERLPNHNTLCYILESHERLRAELQGAETLLADERAEVRAVLAQLDELAASWGDEGVFRRRRDRLRSVAGGVKPWHETR